MKFLGVDLGGTKIKAGIVLENGNIIDKAEIDTPVEDGIDGIVDSILMLIDKLLKSNGLTLQSIKAIGVGIPGVCNREGLVYYAPNLFWNHVPLGSLLKEEIGVPIFIENDATVAAIGEATCGVTKGVSNSVLLTLGTGIGSGIIINGNTYSGNHGIGSEIGHMIVGENFYDCNCGNNGCLETFASATALVRYAEKLLMENSLLANQLIENKLWENKSLEGKLVKGKSMEDIWTKSELEENGGSLILERIGNKIDRLDAKLIFDCAKKGDILANKAVDRLVKYLAIGIANIINILDPEVIVIGGGISKAGSFLIDKLNREIPKYIWLKSMNLTEIVLASLENDAGIVGSAMFAKIER